MTEPDTHDILCLYPTPIHACACLSKTRVFKRSPPDSPIRVKTHAMISDTAFHRPNFCSNDAILVVILAVCCCRLVFSSPVWSGIMTMVFPSREGSLKNGCVRSEDRAWFLGAPPLLSFGVVLIRIYLACGWMGPLALQHTGPFLWSLVLCSAQCTVWTRHSWRVRNDRSQVFKVQQKAGNCGIGADDGREVSTEAIENERKNCCYDDD